MTKQRIRQVLIVAAMALAGFCYAAGCAGGPGSSPPILDAVSEPFVEPEASAAASILEETKIDKQPLIYVHVCGEVNRPDVYALEAGSRIYQAVEQAGGLTEQAGAEALNMAQLLEDGMKVYIPDKEVAVQQAAAQQSDLPVVEPESRKVNLNTATKEQLMTLKGIGEARAGDIMTYRQQNGRFQTIEDIMKVPGIKEAAFQKIKENITV